MAVAVVFPGQGKQAPGMGAPWRGHPAWSVVERAEAALGEPLAPLLTDTPADLLRRTRAAQLAVLLTSLIVWEAARDRIGAPIAFAGHSLGQVAALIAAGALDLEDGVRFAARRAELTQAAADAHPGRMAALLGATPERADVACRAAPGACWLANDNAPGQVVIGGTPDGLELASTRARELGVKRVTAINVGGAFHTPLMDDAATGLAGALAELAFVPPVAPVVSNHDAEPYTDADGWRERLAEHVRVPVRWRGSQRTLVDLGAGALVELGHGTMLTGLARRTVPEVAARGLATPADVDAYGEEG